MKLIAAMHKAFKREGQTLTEFSKEFKALTTADKADFCEWFEVEGTPIEDKENYPR